MATSTPLFGTISYSLIGTRKLSIIQRYWILFFKFIFRSRLNHSKSMKTICPKRCAISSSHTCNKTPSGKFPTPIVITFNLVITTLVNNSDLYGIESEVCERIALKHNKALDFPKTGIAPPLLNSKWDHDVPPEKSERWADFMDKPHEPSFYSPRLLGQLFRWIFHYKCRKVCLDEFVWWTIF